MSAHRVLVFTATYNEIGNIDPFCAQVLALRPEVDLLVVDDHSPDGTGQRLDEISARERRLFVIHRRGKFGLASAHRLAMVKAIADRYDVLVTLDADLSHDPADIRRLVDSLEGCDFVTGSRYMPGGGCNYSGYRLALSKGANWLARRLLGVPLHEFTTSFRAFRIDRLGKFDIANLDRQGYSFFLQTVVALHRAGFRLGEIPIVFHDRNAGESKLPSNAVVDGVLNLLSLTLDRRGGAAEGSDGPDVAVCSSCGEPYALGVVSTAVGASRQCLLCGATS